MTLISDIRDRMAGDATLTAMLGTYASLPCVFHSQVPPDAPRPYVVIDPANVDAIILETLDGKDDRSIDFLISAFIDYTGSAITVDAIAERIRALFHANGRDAGEVTPMAMSGYNGVHTSVAQGPIGVPTDDSLEGRAVTVRCRIERAS